jgi:hypothetical protein
MNTINSTALYSKWIKSLFLKVKIIFLSKLRQTEQQILSHTDRMFVTLSTVMQVKWNIKIFSVMRLKLQDMTAEFCLYLELRI